MWIIYKLDNNLANQISAWEVVERPLSVVKELVENSIDAKANNIIVEIQNWWKTYISIKDNWKGMDISDLDICLEKYTTSKIKNLQDLYNVMTFGFRWEALSSISSVSKIIINTKIKEDIDWYSLSFDNIKWKKVEKIMAEDWTQIIVQDLFFNTPARLNYLKQDKTEYLKVLNYLYEISLSYPNIWFEFISDNRQVFKFNKDEDLKTRIYQIYSKEVYDNILDINFEMVWIKISWYISDPKVSYANRNKQHIFLNSRPINSMIISKAINDAFNRFIPHWLHPFYVINLEVDPTLVDVNVHPRKLEVRFANEQNIFRAVYHAVLNKLEKVSLITENNIKDTQNNSDFSRQNLSNSDFQTLNYYTWSWTKFKEYSPYKDVSSNPNQFKISDAISFTKTILDTNISDEQNDFEDKNIWDLHYTKLWKIVGQSYNSYIIVERNNKIIFYDQHALAERIIYEKLVKQNNISNTQKLLISENIKLTPIELDVLTTNIDVIKWMWFDFEFLSNWIISVSQVPDFVKKQELQNLFLWILEDIWAWNNKSNTLDEVKNKIWAYTACRSAIKFWNKLNLFEMNKLLNDWFETYSSTCPHWRPVVFEIDLWELKDKYER